VMLAVSGNCKIPVAAYAVREGYELWLRGFLADEDGSHLRRGERRIAWPKDADEAARVGADLGAELKRG